MIQLGKITIDSNSHCLKPCNGEPIALRPKTFELLEYLAGKCGQVASRQELHEQIWPDVVVTDDSISKCISEIRRALASYKNIAIKTVTKRGYMLLVEDSPQNLTELNGQDQADPDADAPSSITRSHRDTMPSILVLPFENIGGEAAEFVARGIAEDIITHLARFKDIFVINQSSVRFLKNNYDAAQNVQYLLTGTVQTNDQQLRISIRLEDTEGHEPLWTDRLDRCLTELFTLQDQLAADIVNRIGGCHGALARQERRRITKCDADTLGAYEWYVSGTSLDDILTIEGLSRARDCFYEAVKHDSCYARGWARIALLNLLELAAHGTGDPGVLVPQFIEYALRAYELDQDDSLVCATAATAQAYLDNLENARWLFEKALLLGPNDADTLAVTAYIRPTKLPTVFEDLQNIRRAISLNPYHPAWYRIAHGYCAFHASAYKECLDALSSCGFDFHDIHLYRCLAATQLDQKQACIEHREKLLALVPGFRTEDMLQRDCACNPDTTAHFREAAAKAGLP